jgi:uncharacterized protein YkwD
MRSAAVLAAALAFGTRAAPARADAVADAVAPRCLLDARLAAAARTALARSPALDTAALRARAEAEGLLAPSVRAWVGQGREDGVAALAAQWVARQEPLAEWARCAVACEGARWAVVLVPRAAEVAGARGVVEVGAEGRYEVALPRGASEGRVVVARPDGTIADAAAGGVVRFDVAGEYTLQIVARTSQGPLPFATWHVTAGAPSPTVTRAPTAPIQGSQGVLATINRARREAGALPLRPDPLLVTLAQARAAELALHGVVAHALGPGDSPVARLARAGVRADRIAENVARAGSLDEASRRLDASPSHRANRIDPALDAIGIGVAASTSGVYLVELFAAHPGIAGR